MGEVRFEAMGTWGHVIVHGGPVDGCERARRRIDDLERRWSRFLPDSEVSRLNAGATVVSPDTALLVARAGDAARMTGGRFDATVLGAVVRAGYDHAAALVQKTHRGGKPSRTEGFDPGGIGKGLAADMVVDELMAAGSDGVGVNLGGDLRVEGVPPGGRPWVIDVEDPFGGGGPPLVRLGLNRGAIATSSRLKRAWVAEDGSPRHHLIDPRTGEPAVTDAVAATVVAGTAWRAEAVATAAVVAGISEGLALIESTGVTGLLVAEDGHVHTAAGLGPYLG
ncbi:MAG: FAD:protein FMN transferase [Acidimicrobiales bacterium]